MGSCVVERKLWRFTSCCLRDHSWAYAVVICIQIHVCLPSNNGAHLTAQMLGSCYQIRFFAAAVIHILLPTAIVFRIDGGDLDLAAT